MKCLGIGLIVRNVYKEKMFTIEKEDGREPPYKPFCYKEIKRNR